MVLRLLAYNSGHWLAGHLNSGLATLTGLHCNAEPISGAPDSLAAAPARLSLSVGMGQSVCL